MIIDVPRSLLVLVRVLMGCCRIRKDKRLIHYIMLNTVDLLLLRVLFG